MLHHSWGCPITVLECYRRTYPLNTIEIMNWLLVACWCTIITANINALDRHLKIQVPFINNNKIFMYLMFGRIAILTINASCVTELSYVPRILYEIIVM